ncbi:MAG: glutamate-cysteine ligase family protein [Gemmatimonadota bacterium]
MGLIDVRSADAAGHRLFTRALVRDLQALERMLAEGRIESGVRRFGIEQELFLVDPSWRPATVATEVLERLGGDPFVTELARFNLEFNLDPTRLAGSCFSRVRAELDRQVANVDEAASESGCGVVLAGILPTLTKSDLTLNNMMPIERYRALNEAVTRMRGGSYRLEITGLDELHIEHDSVMLEACNTSAQVHLQVGALEFARLYNVAQALTGPILAPAVNSPLLFGKRLWSETRIALFQQSIDTRSTMLHMRELQPRVRFGDAWLDEGVIELFEEDVAHFRVLLTTEVDEDPITVLDRGGVPDLRALQLHNSTVYRWNRPCYGVSQGEPHLRIECRVLPAGPSVLDEVANAALWIGAVLGGGEAYGDIRSKLPHDAARANFTAAARMGMGAGFLWFGQVTVSAPDLLEREIIPLARQGLEGAGVDVGDIDLYLGIVEERVRSRTTGATWLLGSLASMGTEGTAVERLAALTGASADRQRDGRPVHEWPLARLEEAGDWAPNFQTVAQYMTTSLFTVHEDELVDLAAFLMDRNAIRHVLVENDEHELVGVVSYRSLLRMITQGKNPTIDPVSVSEVMIRDPVTVTPDTPTLEAIDLMRERRVSNLPVVSDGKLVGIVTETDFMPIAYQLLSEALRKD